MNSDRILNSKADILKATTFIVFLLLPFLVIEDAFSQSASISGSSGDRVVEIDNIFITGNKKTRDFVILRELDIKKGQKYALSDLEEIIDENEDNVYNTTLFNSVEMGILDVSPEKVVVQVDVSERWYFYPIPKIDFVDRNFNDWWVNQNHDLSRLNYGLKFTQYNFRGRNERLQLLLQAGYTDAVGLRYTIPYLGKDDRNGMMIMFNYGENTNTAFNTIDHRQRFVDSDEIIRRSLTTGGAFTRYRTRNKRHIISAYYVNRWVGDTVTFLNPNYFTEEGDERQKYFYLSYTYNVDKRDIRAYPLNGYNFEFSVAKSGLGIYNDVDLLAFESFYSKFWEFGKRFFLSNYSSVYLSFPEDQPYANITGIGFSRNVIRGYELNVVEGKSYFMNKTTIKKELININKNLSFIPVKQFQSFPFAAYFKTYFDFGYVRNLVNYELAEQNLRLSDKFIYGGGIGLDIHTSYDLVIRSEYSINSEGNTGFFLNFKKEF